MASIVVLYILYVTIITRMLILVRYYFNNIAYKRRACAERS